MFLIMHMRISCWWPTVWCRLRRNALVGTARWLDWSLFYMLVNL